MIGDLHFLRPFWLIAFAPAALLVWEIARTQDADRVWRGIVADHLLPYLFVKRREHRRIGPLVLLAAIWASVIVAMAGPTWKLAPSPFADDTAPLIIVVRVAPSMGTEDVQPNRLARSVQKIHDLLALRGGARSALIAYSGTAHLVMPLTRDAAIIDTFAAALDPKIMPDEGDAAAEAFLLAGEMIAQSKQAGSILWITDSVASEQRNGLAEFRKRFTTPVQLLAPLLRGPERDALSKTAGEIGASFLGVRPDDADVRELAHQAKFVTATVCGEGDQWQDVGYWLVPMIVLLSAFWFRRGWMVTTSAMS
jgi:Ca-activated chloride channel homolog